MQASEALKVVKPGDKIFIHSVAAAPPVLIDALVARAHELKDVKIYHLHTEGEAPYARPEYEGIFEVNAFFIAKNIRQAIAEGRGSYIPAFLSEVPRILRKHIIKIDVALITVSPPDQHGFCSLGTSVDATRAAVETAEIVIAQVNKNMPRTHGDSQLHMSKIHYMVPHDSPIYEHPPEPVDENELAIAKHVCELIEDGATLQMGIGSIPNAVLMGLNHHKDIGIHTEMFSDGIIPLVEKGVITGKYKRKHPGKIVGTFVMGSNKLYEFIHDNPMVSMLDAQYVNDTAIIRQNPKVTAVNSAIEIDLTGQVCADSIGFKMYSGVGGQMDFIRGASLSEGGKAIIALKSTTKKGVSRISGFLNQGAGVVTTRAHVHYVATEYGVAYLYGKSLKERAKLLISIAHPDHQEQLSKMAYERFKC
ncbi:MAG TPA: acetyl-CoA hydrolase/transferase C-terminal domain-containing protein [Cyclobacteriaceae bacterium]|nr:acetyl-CoA hydrolase/transferase C-terminal domain-containing protein [Cyclobacteriaceae bacterium]